MIKLLTICTENGNFSFNNDVCIQIDGVVVGSPLGPVVANIFIIELESVLAPNFNYHVKIRSRFVGNTFICVTFTPLFVVQLNMLSAY